MNGEKMEKQHNAIILRSKVKWVEDREKNTKFFLDLEKRNYNNKYIKKLITNNNKEITTLEDIIEEEKCFYKELYASQSNKSHIADDFLNIDNIPQLSYHDRMLCDKPLTIEECTKALKLLANNKSPDSDGFTTNFYNFFWIDIKEILFESYKYSLDNHSLSDEQKGAS